LAIFLPCPVWGGSVAGGERGGVKAALRKINGAGSAKRTDLPLDGGGKKHPPQAFH
jgi:hypothetical protein